ncbi:hypothetical protein N0V82_009459 [Gnomoniopsis sp. IMI 355080]|nr:hypothetical protein N0V82_009459 [Gnomoniopsis sp. IMI 355080]
MDPLSAIGLMSSVITFIDFGYEIVAASEEVRTSTTGTTKANDQVEFLNVRLKSVAVELAAAKRDKKYMSVDQIRLVEVADKCLELSDDLQRLLDKLKAKNPSSKRQVLSALARNVRNKNQKKDLEVRLDQCRQLLQLQLSHTTRLESISRLIEISQTGKCQEIELGSLKQQLALLTQAVTGMKSCSKLQDQARHILDLSDHAVSKVLHNKILQALRDEKMESRFEIIEEAHTNTFKWLLEGTTSSSMGVATTKLDDPWLRRIPYFYKEEEPLRRDIQSKLTDWLTKGSGIFHISGKPGAGKSTLMKYLAESERTKEYLASWAGDKELVFASFFFWRHGTDFQRSLHGLLRTLLYSVLEQYPELIRVIFPDQWKAAYASPEAMIHFRQADIQNAFSGLMKAPDIYERHKFAFFIDGLDEFQGREDTLITTLFEWAQSGSDNIKICVSSRELTIFQQRFSKCPKFRLHEVTHYDILLFTYDTLRNNEDVKLLYDPEGVAELGNALLVRAEGVFLWVSLALRLVERGLVLEDNIEDLMNSINVLPTEVEELFEVIFNSIKNELDVARRRKAMRVLSLAVDEAEIAICRDHLYLTTLSFMEDYDHNKEFAKDIKGYLTTTETTKRLSRCQKQLNGGCRGFLSIKSLPATRQDPEDPFRREKVQLSHRSLIEFFKRPDVKECIEEHSQGFDRLHYYCQSLIAELKAWSPGPGMWLCEWINGRGWGMTPLVYRYRYPENEITLIALDHGLYELCPPRKDDVLFEAMLHRIEEALLYGWFNKAFVVMKGSPTFDRLLRSLATCLAYGTSPNAPIDVEKYQVSVSVWQNLVWHSIVTTSLRASLLPVWLLFFLHGAEKDFTLDFSQTCNFSEVDKSGKMVSVTGHWGLDRRQLHSAIYIHEDHGGILKLAKSRDWSLSLMEIINFWFPLHAETFRTINELSEDGAGLPDEHLHNLRQEFGLDPAHWKTQLWHIPRPLFESWKGSSRILDVT